MIKNKIIFKYTLIGFIFGLLFPIFASIFELYNKGFYFSLQNLIKVRMLNPLIMVIDTAPIFLSIFAYVAGVNQWKSVESKIKYKNLATYDKLTGLINRRIGEKKLKKLIDNCALQNHITIFYIDINNFKLVNDTLGHLAGDNVLKNISKRLNEFSCSYGFSSRIGGDEFIVVINETIAYSDIENLAILLSKHLATPVIINNQLIKITSSIGIASYPHDALNKDDLLFSADAAMFNSKKNSLRYSFYDPSFKEKYKKQLLTESQVISSISKDHFEIIYLPLIDHKSLKIDGVEALVKWNNSKNDYYSPSEFIPLIEDNYSIDEIAKWTLEKICTDLKKWKKSNIDDIFVLISLTSEQLKNTKFLKKAQAMIESLNIDYTKIKVKINYDYRILNFYSPGESNKILDNVSLNFFNNSFGYSYVSFELINIFDIKNIRSNMKPKNVCYSINSIFSDYKLKILLDNDDNYESYNSIKKQFEKNTRRNFSIKPANQSEITKMYFNKSYNI